jgi:hypothetical protein
MSPEGVISDWISLLFQHRLKRWYYFNTGFLTGVSTGIMPALSLLLTLAALT